MIAASDGAVDMPLGHRAPRGKIIRAQGIQLLTMKHEARPMVVDAGDCRDSLLELEDRHC